MDAFLLWIGLYNLTAPLLFVPMLFSERFADLVLRRATEIIAEPYTHGPFGRMWLLWVTVANTGLGALMLLARAWPTEAQRHVATVILGVYAFMWLGMLLGARGPRWGRGVYITHGLWLVQMAWCGWALGM
jgi:hypothetical protein